MKPKYILILLAAALLSACASKPLDPALLAGHQAFTSKLVLPQ